MKMNSPEPVYIKLIAMRLINDTKSIVIGEPIDSKIVKY